MKKNAPIHLPDLDALFTQSGATKNAAGQYIDKNGNVVGMTMEGFKKHQEAMMNDPVMQQLVKLFSQ